MGKCGENIVERGRPQVTMWRKRIVCWINKATDRHSERVIITALPHQQWLHESVSLLRYTYSTTIARLFVSSFMYFSNSFA